MKFELAFTLCATIVVVSALDAAKFRGFHTLQSGGNNLKEIIVSTANSYSYETASELCKNNDLDMFSIHDLNTYNAFNEYVKTKAGLVGSAPGVWINGRRDGAQVWFSYFTGAERRPVFVEVPWASDRNTGEPYLSAILKNDKYQFSSNRGAKTFYAACQKRNLAPPVTTTPAPAYNEEFCKKNCGFYTDSITRDLQKNLVDLTAKLAEREKRIAELEALNEQKQKEITTLLEEKRVCLTASGEKDKKISELETRIAQIPAGDQALKAVQKQLEECNSKVQTLTNTITEANVKITGFEAQLAAKNKIIEESKATQEKLIKEISDLKLATDITECQTQLKDYIQKFKDIEAKLALTVTKNEEQVAKYNKTIQELRTEIERLLKTIADSNASPSTPLPDFSSIMTNLARATRLLEILIPYIKANNVQVPDWDLILKEYQTFLDQLTKIVDQEVTTKPDESGNIIVTLPKVPTFIYPFFRVGQNIDSVTKKPIEGTKVITFIVDKQKLNFIPQGLGTSFPELQNLFITNSQIEIVQVGDFDGFGKVTNINLSGNNLKTIKNFVFEGVPKLEILDLSFNKISSVQNKAFENLLELKEIHFNNNLFASLEFHIFQNNAKLVNIYFQNNGLIIIDKVLMQYFMTRKTDLHNNECIDIAFPAVVDTTEQFCLEPATRLKCVFATAETLYQCVAQEVNINKQEYSISGVVGTHAAGMSTKNVKGLIVQDQRMSFIPRKLSKFLPSVEEIFIDNSKLKGLYNNDFSGFVSLRKITIIRNNIKIIEDDTFTKNALLTHAYLIENHITAVPARFFVKNAQIKVIDLSKNEISDVKLTLVPKVNSISHFSLSSNRLKLVDQALVQRMKKTKYVDFTNNNCISSIITLGIEGTRNADELMGIIQCRCVLNPSIDCEGGENDE
jgi:Leucine-rich repeat (LRR) protein